MQTQEILDAIDPCITAVAIIDLDKLASNYRKINSELAKDTVVGAVVKANSYGFGAIQVSKKLYREGCRNFFVATPSEGVEIRQVLNNDANIYSLIGILHGCEEMYEKYRIIPVLNNMYQVNLWLDYSKRIGKKLPAVIQVDTGMSRNGLSTKDMEKYHEKITDGIDISFILSHLACADEVENPQNRLQLDSFKKTLKMFGENVKASFSATNGILLGEEYHFDVVRPGKALYGFSIRKDKVDTFEPVMDVYARIIQISDLPQGCTIGYGATFATQKPLRTVTVGMGYADGFMRKFSGFGHGFINGHKVPIIGRVSMDYVVFDATDIYESEIKIGNWVSFTRDPDYTLERWALEMDTLPHEVSCRFGPRVKRVYVG